MNELSSLWLNLNTAWAFICLRVDGGGVRQGICIATWQLTEHFQMSEETNYHHRRRPNSNNQTLKIEEEGILRQQLATEVSWCMQVGCATRHCSLGWLVPGSRRFVLPEMSGVEWS